MSVIANISLATSVLMLGFFSVGTAAETNKAAKKRAVNYGRRAARSLSLLVANGGGGLVRNDAKIENEGLASWFELNQEALVDAGENPFSRPTRWGVATTNGNKLFLHVSSWPKNRMLSFPRLHNSVISWKFTHSDEKLKFSPGTQQWQFECPKNSVKRIKSPLILEVVLDRVLVLGQSEPPVVRPSENQAVHLHARYAVTHGQLLRFEPQPAKNTVGYWTNAGDWVEWKFQADAKTTYEVFMRYGCGAGQGGSLINIEVGDKTLPFTVEATGGFQKWREDRIGELNGIAGVTTLSVRVEKKAKKAVMDIQEIWLQPKTP